MRNVFITWHYTSHGIAYLKHILSCFYEKDTTDAHKLEGENYDQEYCNSIFDNNTGHNKFDKVFYLTVKQEVINKVSSRLHYQNLSFENDEVLQEKQLVELYKTIRGNKDVSYDIDKELQFVKENFGERFPDFQKYMWRDIQHYDIHEQIKWLREQTNFTKVYGNNEFEAIELSIKDMRNEKEIADNVRDFFSKRILPEDSCVVNISLGGPEAQSVWHILAANKLLPKNTQFIKTYDNKEETKKHFRSFTFKTVSTNLIEDISSQLVLYPKTKSKKRELANKEIEFFLKSGFSVLLLGERGTGKSSIIRELAEKILEKQKNGKKLEVVEANCASVNDSYNTNSESPKKKSKNGKKQKDEEKSEVVEANCASFTNNQIAESELFGYVKGAFTDAKEDKLGLIETAANGILFLDEFHHLDKLIQAKLMKAFQTDKDNNFKIRRLGGIEETTVENVKLVFATNRTIEELHELLLPDFYDRVVQYVVRIPSVRETLEDLEDDWKSIFERLYPKEHIKAPTDKKLIKWLKSLPLKGNFRDLENIAKDYKIFNEFDEDTKKAICSEMKIPISPFEYAKKCYELYHCEPTSAEKIEIKISGDAKSIEKDFHKKLREWAIQKFGSRKEAANRLGVTDKTLDNWK